MREALLSFTKYSSAEMLWFSKRGNENGQILCLSLCAIIVMPSRFYWQNNVFLLLNGTKIFPVIHVAHCATTKLKPFGHKTQIFWSIFSPFKADTISFPRRQDLKAIQYQITNLIYVFEI